MYEQKEVRQPWTPGKGAEGRALRVQANAFWERILFRPEENSAWVQSRPLTLITLGYSPNVSTSCVTLGSSTPKPELPLEQELPRVANPEPVATTVNVSSFLREPLYYVIEGRALGWPVTVWMARQTTRPCTW